MIFRRIARELAPNDLNLLQLPEGIGLCCNETDTLKNYATAEFNATTVGDADTMEVSVNGGSTVVVTFASAVAWDDPANDAALMEAISDAVQHASVDGGNFCHIDGGIVLTRGATDNLLTVEVRNSTLTIETIGPSGTLQALTGTAVGAGSPAIIS